MKLCKSLSLLVVGAGLVACDTTVVAQDGKPADAQAQAQADADVKGDAKAEIKAEGKVEVAAKGKVELKTDDLDLESATFLIKKGKVKDAAGLEKALNNPKEKLNKVDIDGDGKVDKIMIVEVKNDDGTIVFEIRAVPSSTKDKDAAVVVAYITFAPDKETKVLVVKATYAPIVVGYDVVVYDYTTPIVIENDVVVVTGDVGFYGWLFAVRPVYVGVVVWDVAPVVVFEECWPPGHCKHHGKHKYKFKGKGKHGWH